MVHHPTSKYHITFLGWQGGMGLACCAVFLTSPVITSELINQLINLV